LVLQAGVCAAAAPKADLWPRWRAHDAGSRVGVDHSAWAAFLKKYLSQSPDGINRVAYDAVTPAGHGRLAGYIARLAAVPVSRLRRAEQLAYWVNLYNAMTVKVILDNYPVSTILWVNISPGWFSFGPWDKKLLTVEGEKFSLNDIEHRILRPIWRDPRIHYAVNCASLGCPNLAPLPYTAQSAGGMLDEAARTYVNHPRGAKVTGRGLIVSSIFHWYKANFGGTDAGVIAHLKKFAAPALAQRLENVGEIYDHEYDWNLNLDPSRVSPEKIN
jgi:hypothetical protein